MLVHHRDGVVSTETPPPKSCPHCAGPVVIVSRSTPAAEFSFNPYENGVQCKRCGAKGPVCNEFRDAILEWNAYCDKFKVPEGSGETKE